MHPAPSVILFSVLSGAGFGLLAYLGLAFAHPYGLMAFLWWGLGYSLAIIGLLASTFHLGNPKRAWRAFTQWRSSWLSREAWASVAALVACAPAALSAWLGLDWSPVFGWIGAVLALSTVFTTSMIYAQIRAVPRWHHWLTPVMFLTFAVTGGALLSGQGRLSVALCAVLTVVLFALWRVGDGQFERAAQTLGTATGLDRIGEVTVFEQAHTAGNYLLREMIFVVARKHVQKLRTIALLLACGVPGALMLYPSAVTAVVATISHLIGACVARWLFFATAEHVVGLYYGKR